MATKKMDTMKHNAIDTKIIRDLAEILNDTNLTNIELEQGELRIRVSRQNTSIITEQTICPPISNPTVAITPPSSTAEIASSSSAESEASTLSEDKLKNAITSPMVGTAYLAPAPGAQVFVEVGQRVSEGETLLIIEAMKTMNHITSPHSGTVKAILVKDGQPVEFGEPLIVVE
ncbi:acetyl-CoA carboxylase biotin carboxyl carrier protein [Bartonella sp. B30(2025)]